MTPTSYSGLPLASTVGALEKVLSKEVIDGLAQKFQVVERDRLFSVSHCVSATLSTLGSGGEVSIASIHRSYNAKAEFPIDYKAFYRKVSSDQFSQFMIALFEEGLNKLFSRALKPKKDSPFASFTDIILHDGTSFALREALRKIFPGRFTTTSPAAVEVHVTYSALDRSFYQVTSAPDKEAEKHFRPEPQSLEGKLLLADRGYHSMGYFKEIHEAGGSYVIRGRASASPFIVEARNSKGKRLRRLEKKPISRDTLPQCDVDLVVEYRDKNGEVLYQERMVLLYRKGKQGRKEYQRLHTNLDREKFSVQDIDTLYRYRWQIELVMKELKSHSGLKKINTANPNIVEAFLFASFLIVVLRHYILNKAQLLTSRPLSTHKAASAAAIYFCELVSAIVFGTSEKRLDSLQTILRYLSRNAVRSNVKRDQEKGALRMPLEWGFFA
jgi:Transposase DDE domain